MCGQHHQLGLHMSIHPRGGNFSVSTQEVPFEFSELFFSRTDTRGVIASGNEVFRRISGFSWEELVGAPHKIIRHPDMPKGVFYILWERIKKGLPTGAYVKNRAKDGKYYWVYAVVSPIPGGFLSVRLKPSSEMFGQVQALYASILGRETEEGLTPEESASAIRKALRYLGFPSYSAFSSFALSEEVASRDRHLARSEDRRLKSMNELLPTLGTLEAEQKDLVTSFEKIRGIPSNMRIVASRLEPAGGPISAISQNYRLMSDEVTTHLGGLRSRDGFESMSSSVMTRVYDGLFMMAASRLQREVKEVALASLTEDSERDGFQTEVEGLARLLEGYSLDSGRVLMGVCSDIERLARSAKDLRQLVTGLDSIRVLCRVEAGRLGGRSSALTPVITQLDAFHVEIDANLDRIMHLAEEIKALVESAMPRSYSGVALDEDLL
ncbi:PAS domain-containing protein [Celeribacter litoreus]|uniref:PAS domain-containing protein n=1 Tax=Celeribacter litoreus TaxID=2876714 RepID=UPI001CC8EF0A|nr:PAS domain-containing protein [Celeribacter litoreus]MCA0044333.1 PAS domain-containing protein [Celeribacter litoreus]